MMSSSLHLVRIPIFRCVLAAICIFCSLPAITQTRYVLKSGTVSFVSDAPLERIAATSKELNGVIDPEARTFAFTIDISSFLGFNSPLQRVHFNENYMETTIFPTATFTGKFIEDIDLFTPGTYDVRVKGKLMIHGVSKERIIKGTVHAGQGTLDITSVFTILLEDHNIRIPRVVYQKIAKVVTVEVAATFISEKS